MLNILKTIQPNIPNKLCLTSSLDWMQSSVHPQIAVKKLFDRLIWWKFDLNCSRLRARSESNLSCVRRRWKRRPMFFCVIGDRSISFWLIFHFRQSGWYAPPDGSFGRKRAHSRWEEMRLIWSSRLCHWHVVAMLWTVTTTSSIGCIYSKNLNQIPALSTRQQLYSNLCKSMAMMCSDLQHLTSGLIFRLSF